MDTIAQAWQDFMQCTYGSRLEPDVAREYRMLFATGFNTCLRSIAALGRSDYNSEEMTERIEAYMLEYQRFAQHYIEQRQKEQ